MQDTSAEALKLRNQVSTGMYLYRAGQIGHSNIVDAQFWAPENPLTPGYADKYGVDFKTIDYIIRGKLKPGANFITRLAPGLGNNKGGALEIVTNPNSVQIDSYFMP